MFLTQKFVEPKSQKHDLSQSEQNIVIMLNHTCKRISRCACVVRLFLKKS